MQVAELNTDIWPTLDNVDPFVYSRFLSVNARMNQAIIYVALSSLAALFLLIVFIAAFASKGRQFSPVIGSLGLISFLISVIILAGQSVQLHGASAASASGSPSSSQMPAAAVSAAFSLTRPRRAA